jgi:uncharacterized protein (DUF2252 family)
MAVASASDSIHNFRKLTATVDGERRFVSHPPLLSRTSDPDESRLLHKAMAAYASSLRDGEKERFGRYRIVDTAMKVVGVGSVGLAAYAVLLQGRDDDDPLFLQLKEARASVLAPFTKGHVLAQHGHRVVAGQRLMQAASDIFLGWQRVTGLDGVVRDFYLRQLRDWKGSADVDAMTPSVMTAYARICGATLARAHARSGDRIAIAAYLGSSDVFDRAIADFSVAYADQNERDYETMVAAVASGRLEAQTGL